MHGHRALEGTLLGGCLFSVRKSPRPKQAKSVETLAGTAWH